MDDFFSFRLVSQQRHFRHLSAEHSTIRGDFTGRVHECHPREPVSRGKRQLSPGNSSTIRPELRRIRHTTPSNNNEKRPPCALFLDQEGNGTQNCFSNFLKRGLARRSDRQKKLFFLFFLIGVSKTGRRFNYTMFDRAIRTRPIRQARAINQSRSAIFDDDSTDPSSDLGRSISLPLMNFVRV